MVFAPAMATATGEVRPEDAGVASALVNTMQQVGGSIGVALLSTFSATAATGFVASHGGPAPSTLAEAAVHGYTTAFWWAAGILFLGALLTSLLLRPGVQAHDPAAVPVPAH
jgi:hypothetical protein